MKLEVGQRRTRSVSVAVTLAALIFGCHKGRFDPLAPLDPLLDLPGHWVDDRQKAMDEQAEADAANAATAKREREAALAKQTGVMLRRERERDERQRALPQAPTEISTTPIDQGPPDRLSAAMIRQGIAAVAAGVRLCAKPQIKGQVLVAVNVAPGGHVVAVAIIRSMDASVGTCVAAVVRETTFAPTRSGGAFRYPFVF